MFLFVPRLQYGRFCFCFLFPKERSRGEGNKTIKKIFILFIKHSQQLGKQREKARLCGYTSRLAA